MLKAIDTAVHNFCSNIIGIEATNAKYLGNKLYGAAIAIVEDETEHQCYLFFKKETLNEFSKILLFEENLAEDELDDLVKEVANMVVGSAKVYLETLYPTKSYSIGVPDFLGHVDNPKILNLEEILLYKLKNRTFGIGKRKES